MTTTSRSGRYTRFLSLAVAIVVGLCALGWLPTRRLAGAEAVVAMMAGCAISLVSAALAGWLLIVVGAETPEARMQRGFLAMVVRLAVVVVLGAGGRAQRRDRAAAAAVLDRDGLRGAAPT